MPSQPVTAEALPAPTGPYSLATLATGTRVLSISGQIADGPDAEEQARRCLQAIDQLLAAAGASKTDIVRVGIFVTDMADRAGVARARTEYFGDHRPAATLVEVSALVAPEFRVEIEATAIF